MTAEREVGRSLPAVSARWKFGGSTRVVMIENQLELSDDDHRDRALSYLAATGARISPLRRRLDIDVTDPANWTEVLDWLRDLRSLVRETSGGFR